MESSDTRGEQWFASTYAAHYPDIVRYGLRRLADLEASTDLAQEVFIIAWRRRREVPDRSLPWLYGVARRVLANAVRARGSRPLTVPIIDAEALTQETTGSRPESAVTIADVRTAMARLSGLDQEILRLVGWEQLTVTEAAVALGCGRAAAAVRLHRARRRLAKAMAGASSTSAASRVPAQL